MSNCIDLTRRRQRTLFDAIERAPAGLSVPARPPKPGVEPETAYPHPRELGLLESAIKAATRKRP